MSDLGPLFYGAYLQSPHRINTDLREWDELGDEEQRMIRDGAQAVADSVAAEETATPEGQWMRIGFFGHIKLTGYVTEVTVGGQPVFHIDLPGKIWGGNPLEWEEYAASALHNRRPLTEETVRREWEAGIELARRRAAQQAEWARQQQAFALEAAAADCGDGEDGEREDLTGATLYVDDDEQEPF